MICKDLQKYQLIFLKINERVKYNYAYFPILVDPEKYGISRDDLYNELQKHNIYGRRYYYPLISNFSAYKGLGSAKSDNLPVANKITNQVICLPIYPDLEISDVKNIIDIIKS